MGGIVTTGIAISCDRCKKQVPVTEEKQAEFYRKWSKREDKDDRMSVIFINTPDGESHEADFEYLCPKCTESIKGYIDKIVMKKAPPKKKEEEEEEDKKPAEGKEEADQRNPEKEETEEKKEGKEEPKEPAAEEPEEKEESPEEEAKPEPEAAEPEEKQDKEKAGAGEDFDDDELFD
jgi:hypothetical protein